MPTRRTRFALSIAAAAAATIILVAPAAPQKSNPVETKVVEGVPTTISPDKPRDGVKVMRFLEDVSCGLEGREGAILNQPFDLNVGRDGTIYVVDWGDTTIKVYDGAGKHVRNIGRRGQGPGEYERPFWVVVASDGRVIVLAMPQKQLIVFKPDGTFDKGFPLQGSQSDLKIDGSDRLYLQERIIDMGAGLGTEMKSVAVTNRITRRTPDGSTSTVLGDLTGETMMMSSSGGGGVVSMMGGGSQNVWTVAPDGRIFGGLAAQYLLTVRDAAWKPVAAFGRKFAVMSETVKLPAGGERTFTLPAIGRMIFDESGRLWVQQFQADDARDARTKKDKAKDVLYDVFSPAGIYVEQVRVPFRVSAFHGGRVYGIDKTEDELAVVRAGRLAAK